MGEPAFESEGPRVEFMSFTEPAPGDICQVCGDTGPDHRTLRIACLYDLSEVSDKFTRLDAHDQVGLWSLRICKDCRGQFLTGLKNFIDSGPAVAVEKATEELNPERNIPVRVMGTTVMMTLDEYNQHKGTQSG